MRNRTVVLAVLCAGAAATVAPTAGAATVNTPNACWSSFESRYRQLPATLSASFAPASPGVGKQARLTGLRLKSALPSWMPVFAYNLGLLEKGTNSIPTLVHVAVSVPNSRQKVQIVTRKVMATAVITDPDGRRGSDDERSTPVRISVNLATTTWTPSRAGAVPALQAGRNTLRPVPGAANGGRTYNPTGSIFVSASLGLAKVNFDCRPGTVSASSITTYRPGTARPFALATARR